MSLDQNIQKLDEKPSPEDDASLEQSLIASIKLPDLAEVFADLGEAGLDHLVDEGVVRDIPILGTLLRLRSTAGVVRDYVFSRKVARFLLRIGDIPQETRQRFIAEIESKDEQRRLGETLILLLDRMDDFDKPSLLALLFAAYVAGRYDLATFRRLSTALDRISLASLPALRAFYAVDRTGVTVGGDDVSESVASGLVGLRFFATSMSLTTGAFVQTDLGRLFLEVIDAA